MARVLLVGVDPDLCARVESTLAGAGHDLRSVDGAAPALAEVATWAPDLVVVDSGRDGRELCARLRLDPVASAAALLAVSALADPTDKLAALAAGADDFILAPFDVVELLARVSTLLARAATLGAQNPLRGLADGAAVLAEIDQRLSAGEAVACCRSDLDGFAALIGRYGLRRGDGAITLVARVLQRAALAAGSPLPLIGHLGGCDFLVACTPEQTADLPRRALTGFDDRVRALYDAEDVAQGTVTVTDRRGAEHVHPLATLSIGVASSATRPVEDARTLVAAATELLAAARRQPGSAVAVDRRRS